ncbi:MAG: DNA replication/repair protein RecF [Candidatus Lumbricidophila eiseniae]|uniref:DNA replication and repair protein RecF n=1 Tax=Candidatus Lumbricidiphila eiseniae TaxID=1969409 RepID=A0A2A6FRZ3_9MICO|nr:MAG: DNA replication/repair protein RecF [Candidatus Lumbricidophila eiseniae]
MHISRLELLNFRNYERAQLDLNTGITIFVGANGQGKTNLIEAIGYLATVSSHRVSTDQPLVLVGAEFAIVRARLSHADRDVLVELQINKNGANRAQLNGNKTKIHELPRYAKSVLFSPEDLAIVRGEPSVRRRVLDELLVQRSPRLLGVLADYEKVVRQRNSLLKSSRAHGTSAHLSADLDFWDEHLVAFGSDIIDSRLALIEDLRDPISSAYRELVGTNHGATLRAVLSIDGNGNTDVAQRVAAITPETDSVLSTADRFRNALVRTQSQERDRALTLVGPHRDEVYFELNGLPTRGYASHGESWSFALSIRLASAELLRTHSQSGDPVLILDDVFAELDRSRRERLAELISGFEQVLVTAAVLEDVPPTVPRHLVHIEAGSLVGGQDV